MTPEGVFGQHKQQGVGHFLQKLLENFPACRISGEPLDFKREVDEIIVSDAQQNNVACIPSNPIERAL